MPPGSRLRYPVLKKIEVDYDFIHDRWSESVPQGFNLGLTFGDSVRDELARRLAMSLSVQDDRLKGVSLPLPEMVWDHDPVGGTCRLIPEEGVILVVTDEQKRETCFGFLRYPKWIMDFSGKTLAETNAGPGWLFEDFLNSPDPRFRRILARFRQRGFVAHEQDDFA